MVGAAGRERRGEGGRSVHSPCLVCKFRVKKTNLTAVLPLRIIPGMLDRAFRTCCCALYCCTANSLCSGAVRMPS